MFSPCRDNFNSAHLGDEVNPQWYVQSQAESLRAVTTNVSTC